MGAEGQALHKPVVCEAKDALHTAKQKRTKQIGAEGRALHKSVICEAKYALHRAQAYQAIFVWSQHVHMNIQFSSIIAIVNI